MKRVLLIGLLAFLVMGAASDASADVAVVRYMKNRWNDFLDLFVLEVGVPRQHHAFGVHLRATDYMQMGMVNFEGLKIGLDGRAVGSVYERKDQLSFLLWSKSVIDQEPLVPKEPVHLGRPTLRNGVYRRNDGREMPWSLGLEVQLPPCIGGIELGFSPCQFTDFVLGFLTIDTWNDDASKDGARDWRHLREPTKPKKEPVSWDYIRESWENFEKWGNE